MTSTSDKEPDFYPFRLKDHGWVLKKGVQAEQVGEAFRDIVYQLVTKDFQPGSVAEAMYNDAVAMMKAKSESGRKAANARWHAETAQPPPKQSLPRSIPPPRNKDDVFDFAAEKGIPDWAVIDWWQQNYVERAGHDKDGNRIANWKGALINYYKTEKTKGNENEL